MLATTGYVSFGQLLVCMLDSWFPVQTVLQADFKEQWWEECPHRRQIPSFYSRTLANETKPFDSCSCPLCGSKLLEQM